jgi:hypothetical protein
VTSLCLERVGILRSGTDALEAEEFILFSFGDDGRLNFWVSFPSSTANFADDFLPFLSIS